MKDRYYAAQAQVGLLYVSLELGKPEVKFCVSNNKLDWNEVILNKEQRLGLTKWLAECPME